MKKILIASTALVAFGVASAAQASSPIKLELGGSAQWMVGVATQKSSFKDGRDYSSTDVKGNNYLNVNGSTVLDNGMKVGVVFLFRAGGNSNTDHNGDPLDRSYVYLEGRLGKLMVGTVDQAPKILQVTAPDAAGLSEDAGNGIVSGRWVVSPNMNGRSDFYYLDTTKINTGDASEKIVYYTPKFAGFTLGVGFAPGTSSSGWSDTGNRDMGTANETYSVGLGYDNTFSGDVRLRAALGWQFSNQFNGVLSPGKGGFAHGGALGGAISGTTDEYNDYNGGIQVSFSGFTIGGGIRYRDINDSGAWKDVEQLAWSVGVQYAFDKKVVPLTLSLNYYDVESELKGYTAGSSKKKDRVHNANLSAKYELGTGVNWISSVGWIDFDSNDDSVKENEGVVVMTGLGLAF